MSGTLIAPSPQYIIPVVRVSASTLIVQFLKTTGFNSSATSEEVAELMGSLIVSPNVQFEDLDDVLINTVFIVPSTKYTLNLKNRPPIDDYFIFFSIVRVSSSDYGQIAIDYYTGQIYTRIRGENWVKVS